MKRLLNTLYVLSPDRYLSLDGENIVISEASQTVARFPLHTIESICYFGHAGASPALMGKCAEMQISLYFFSPSGKFLAQSVGESKGNVLLRRTQYRIADQDSSSLQFAKWFIVGKIYNSRWVLERTMRDHPDQIDLQHFQTVSYLLYEMLSSLMDCTSPDILLGIEGKSAEQYFSCFNDMILRNKSDFYFNGRNRRPPRDNVNALLSFGYTMLQKDCASALSSVGLDPYVGFFHRDRPGRMSLALDLMEELRAVMVDRFVLYLINLGVINDKMFNKPVDEYGIKLTDQGRKLFLSEWQKRKQENIKHPFLQESIPWGLVPYVQAMLLARCLRGDSDAYPPFFWK